MKVVIGDGSELARLGFRMLEASDLGIEICGEAATSEDLLRLVDECTPDLILIDYTSIGFEIDAVAKISKKFPKVGILAITPEQGAAVLVDALRSGVTSYVKKDCSFAEILDAVRETHSGMRFFCGQILEIIQKANLNVDDVVVDGFSCDAVMITERECEIIRLIAEGLTNPEIAERLFLSNHTVNTHRKNIMTKLNVKNTAGIVMYAVKMCLVSPNQYLFKTETDAN